jgi:hypothetical protein
MSPHIIILAIPDRLLQDSTTINIRAEGCRLKRTASWLQASPGTGGRAGGGFFGVPVSATLKAWRPRLALGLTATGPWKANFEEGMGFSVGECSTGLVDSTDFRSR